MLRKTTLTRILLTIVALASCTANRIERGEYRIELSLEGVDKYEMKPGGAVLGPNKPSSRYYEEIKRFPEAYTVKHTYSICMQKSQEYFRQLSGSEEERERYFGRFTDQSFEEWQKRYTLDTLDCIVSFCLVEDSSGNDHMIFDENNDEDLANDPVTESQTKSYYYESSDTSIEVTYFDSNVEFQYYDGSKTIAGECGIRLRKIEGRPGVFAQSSSDGRFGRVRIGGEDYLIGVIGYPDVETTRYDFLWIDLNGNGKHDIPGDHFEQMYHPFTLANKSFREKEIDRFGESLTLAVCDPDSIPPVAVGLPAPDFVATTTDSAQVRLSNLVGQVVMLDFWTCSGPAGLSFTDNIYQEFKDNQNLRIVSFGPYVPDRFPPELKDVGVDWFHVNGFTKDPTRNLYQVGGHHVTFLVDPEGIIAAKEQFVSEQDMVQLIRESLQNNPQK